MPHPITKAQEKQLKKLGERIQSIRTEKGLTLQQVAHNIGKDRQTIHRAEKGDFNPSYLFLLELCKGLEVSIDELLKDL